jgi:hypothetical protein
VVGLNKKILDTVKKKLVGFIVVEYIIVGSQMVADQGFSEQIDLAGGKAQLVEEWEGIQHLLPSQNM